MNMKKTAQNDITGDFIVSKPASDMFGENFDRIFRKKEPMTHDELVSKMMENPEVANAVKESFKDNEELYKDISRIEQIGQNGNDGLHYEYELDKSTGEVIKKDDR